MGWTFIGNTIVNRRGGGQSWSSYCTPLNLVLAEIVGGVRLTWEQDAKCTTEDGFEIWISIDSAAYVLLDTVLADVVTYDDMTDYAGSTVEYKVRAYKGTVYSEYSAEAEITIEAEITNLAVVWAEDHAVLTWDEQAGWDTEIYSSRDNTNWTLDTTIAAGTETYNDHCWQGTTVYFRARAKNGTDFGPYCSSINIVTPLVLKYNNNPATAFSGYNFGLPAGKTVNIDWGDGTNTDYTTTVQPTHAYHTSPAVDPYYMKLSGDLDSITTFRFNSNVLCYGDLSKWVIPSGITDLRLFDSLFTGDLSSWVIPAGCAIVYLTQTDGKSEFTAPPRGNLKQIESSIAGLYMRNANCSIAALDAFLAYANTYFATNTPVRNSVFIINGTGMGIPTGGNSNTNIVGIKAKYVAAGYTATITINT